MGHSNSKANIVEATNEVVQKVYSNLQNTLDIESSISTTVNQKISINLPLEPGCNFRAINYNVSSGTIMQTASAETLNSLSAGLNSKFDSNINQLNQDGADALFGILGANQNDTNTITAANIIKNEIHNRVCNAIRAVSNINTEVTQEIDYNPTTDSGGAPQRSSFPINFSCGSTLLENISSTKAQIGQAACSIVQNVAGISTISDDTLKAAQTDTGFLGDLVSSFASIISKVMYVVIIVAIVGLVLTAAGGLIYFTTRPSHPRSSDSLLDGIGSSLFSQ